MSADGGRQIRLLMLMMNEIRPGSVCMDTKCPLAATAGVPHMANDAGPHPHPYGVISTRTHEWRRKRWWKLRHV